MSPKDSASRRPIRDDLRTTRAAGYITRTVDAAPPLTIEQRDRLACLLRPGAAA